LKHHIINKFLILRHHEWAKFRESTEVFLQQWKTASEFIKTKLKHCSRSHYTESILEIELSVWLRRVKTNCTIKGSGYEKLRYVYPNGDTFVELTGRRLTQFMMGYGYTSTKVGQKILYYCEIIQPHYSHPSMNT
jgi:hypothetical protein